MPIRWPNRFKAEIKQLSENRQNLRPQILSASIRSKATGWGVGEISRNWSSPCSRVVMTPPPLTSLFSAWKACKRHDLHVGRSVFSLLPCDQSFNGFVSCLFFRELVLKGKGLGEEKEKKRIGKNQCHWVLSQDFCSFGGFGKPSIIQQPWKPFLLWTLPLLHVILKIYTWLGFLKA